MDILVAILCSILLLGGLLGCFLPAVPGPPLSLAALLMAHWITGAFSTGFIVLWIGITVAVVLLDYYLPVWTAKKYGATRQGVIGSILGMILGLFFTPVGMLGGLIIGAIAGDIMAGRSHAQAARSGIATVFGTLMSIGLKLVVSGILTYYTVMEFVRYFLA